MKQFGGPAAFIDRNDINTDEIIPAKYLTEITKKALAPHLLEDLRLEGSEFDPHSAEMQAARVLVTRANFGCGSSREHAPWAIADFGIRVIIAPSFADIFHNNCFKNGLLPIVLVSKIVDDLFARASGPQALRISVDLPEQVLVLDDGTRIAFELDAGNKERLLKGLDDIGVTLEQADAIRAYEARRRVEAPWLFLTPG